MVRFAVAVMFFKTKSNAICSFVLSQRRRRRTGARRQPQRGMPRWNAEISGRGNASLATGRSREAEEKCVLAHTFFNLI